VGLFEKVIIAVNIVSFLITGYDKFKAKRGYWRVPEKTLFFLAFILGAPGVLIGMEIFRHKTKHRTFLFGIPTLLILNAICYYYIKTRLHI
jgi:uncharacterized membrane protein YsdA (DUF1294 family)